jgi:nitrate/TMAO reductase-like tetraheme cytochrome c subunit
MAALLSPWKSNPKDVLPTVERMKEISAEKDQSKRQAMMTPVENKVYLSVYQTCAKCHDIDNDPKFDLFTYWPNITHTGLKKKK